MSDFASLKTGLIQSVVQNMDGTNAKIMDFLDVQVSEAKANLYDRYQARIDKLMDTKATELQKDKPDTDFVKFIKDQLELLQNAQRKMI